MSRNRVTTPPFMARESSRRRGRTQAEGFTGRFDKSRVLEFLDFINMMRGKDQDATFQEKRNALDVLGVKAYISKTDEGEFGKKGFKPKSIEITYAPLFTGVKTS